MSEIIINANIHELEKTLDFIKSEMINRGCKINKINQALLLCEECLVSIIDKSNSDITITIKNRFGKLLLNIVSTGEELNINNSVPASVLNIYEEDDSSVAYAIRNILMKHYADRFKYSRKGNVNYVSIILSQDEQFQLKISFSAILLAIVLGLLFKLGIPQIGMFIYNNFFSPITTIFIKSMKCLVGPIVFLSILNSVIGFDDMKLLGRVGTKVILLYTLTSIIATIVSIGLFIFINPGELGSYVPDGIANTQTIENNSLVSMIVGFFPDNAIAAFMNNNTIQIIIIAVACGIALNTMGERNVRVNELITALNEMVNRICSYITKVIPIVIVCSISGLILKAETDTLISLLHMFLVIILGLAVMVVVYCLLIAIFAKVNPLILLKKYLPTALTVFSISSSSATLPINMEFANKIGISKKVSSFSIPLGATINMDGGCIALPITVLFLAKIYGVTFDTNMLLQLMFLSIMISMGAPGVAGGITAFMIPLLAIGGVPAEMGLIVMGIDTIIDMFRTVLNTLGDQSATLVAAASEDLLDTKKYYSK